jgi:predicted dehydrogenase
MLAVSPDAVTIAAPTHLHRDVALACIAKIHVLVEKPIASSVEEGNEIVAAARAAGVTLMVGHVERFNPAVAAIKQAIKDEEILSIAITRVGPFPPRMSNVGVVIDLAVHDIDLIRWFTRSDIVDVQPQLASAVAEREDIALLQFRTASGVLAHINTNWLTPFKARSVTVATRGKYIQGDLLTRQVTECFGFQRDGSYSMRHLSVGHDEPLRRTHCLPRCGAKRQCACRHRRRRRREPRNRDQCLDAPAGSIAAPLRKGPRAVAS